MKNPRPEDMRCPTKGCGGALHNVSSRLATSLGVLQIRCGVCKQGWAFKVGRDAEKWKLVKIEREQS